MIGHNKYAKAILSQLPLPPLPPPPPKKKKLFYSKLLNSVFATSFQLYFLTNEITSVHDSTACFIQYVFEFYYL